MPPPARTPSPHSCAANCATPRPQVAELVTACLDNPDLAANRILEVTADTNAPRQSLEDLLAGTEVREGGQAGGRAAGASRCLLGSHTHG